MLGDEKDGRRESLRARGSKEVAVQRKLARMLFLGVAFGIWSCGGEDTSSTESDGVAGSDGHGCFLDCGDRWNCFLIRWLATPTGFRDCRSEAGESALEIVHRRYALDEISKEEFEDKMKDLGY